MKKTIDDTQVRSLPAYHDKSSLLVINEFEKENEYEMLSFLIVRYQPNKS